MCRDFLFLYCLVINDGLRFLVVTFFQLRSLSEALVNILPDKIVHGNDECKIFDLALCYSVNDMRLAHISVHNLL